MSNVRRIGSHRPSAGGLTAAIVLAVVGLVVAVAEARIHGTHAVPITAAGHPAAPAATEAADYFPSHYTLDATTPDEPSPTF